MRRLVAGAGAGFFLTDVTGNRAGRPRRGFRFPCNLARRGKKGAALARGPGSGQYSDASMIVSTRTVWLGSLGSSLPCCMSGA